MLKIVALNLRNILYLHHQTSTNTHNIMTKQSKINRLEKSGKKVQFLMNASGVIVSGKKFNSINEAYNFFF